MVEPAQLRRSRYAALVIEALDNLVAVDRREKIVTAALAQSGRDDLPDDPVQLVAFAHGPLRAAASALLDDETVWALIGEISVAATVALRSSQVPEKGRSDVPTDPPSDVASSPPTPTPPPSRAESSPSMPRRRSDPAAKRHHTVGYQAALLTPEHHDPTVLVVSPDDPSQCSLCQRFSSAGYEVRKAEPDERVSWLVAKLEPKAVVVQAMARAEADAFLQEMRDDLGAEAPPVLVIVPGQEGVVAVDGGYFLDDLDEVLDLANQLLGHAGRG